MADPTKELTIELLLTAICFAGVEGYRNSYYRTPYLILLYDSSGGGEAVRRLPAAGVPASTLVSEFFPEVQSDPDLPFTIRMQVLNAMKIVSALHLDYAKKNIALEQGSDRHTTFANFRC